MRRSEGGMGSCEVGAGEVEMGCLACRIEVEVVMGG